MIKQEDKDKIKALGLDPEALENAFKSEQEVDVVIPSGIIYDETTIAARDANKLDEGKRLGISEGKQAGFEIANKTIIEKFGLKDVKKSDDPTKVLDVLSASVMQGDEGLKGQVKELQRDKESLMLDLENSRNEKKVFERNTTLLSHLPKQRLSTLSDNEYLTLMSGNIEEVDGKIAVKINGEIVRHPQTRDIVDLKDGISQLFASRNWLDTHQQGTGGRGAGDGHGQSGITPKTFSQATESWEKEHGEGSTSTPEYRAYIEKLAKDKNFNLDA